MLTRSWKVGWSIDGMEVVGIEDEKLITVYHGPQRSNGLRWGGSESDMSDGGNESLNRSLCIDGTT